ncbi:MAG: gliding motility-associated C-terminal domain-containing protein, partial [Bacteroidota bacterium]
YNWTIRNASDNTVISTVDDVTSVDVNTPVGTDTVWVVADITTTIGCQVRDSIRIRNFPSDADIQLSDGSASDDVTLEEDNFISLTAQNVTNPRWRPNEIMSDSTNLTVTVFPNQPSTIVTLIGTDENGCTVSSQIEVILDNLRPKRTFSPNGDGLNDCWEILNSSQENTVGCKVTVFDARGRNIFEGEAPFENNCVWDGNFNNSPVLEGIYYFVLKCDNNLSGKSGSILLAR